MPRFSSNIPGFILYVILIDLSVSYAFLSITRVKWLHAP